MEPMKPAPGTVVTLDGPIAEDLIGYAQRKVDAALRHTGLPVLHSAVVVTRHQDPARTRPITAHINADLNGRVVHARIAAATPKEAVDLLVDRLLARLGRLGPGWRYRYTHRDRARPAEPGDDPESADR